MISLYVFLLWPMLVSSPCTGNDSITLALENNWVISDYIRGIDVWEASLFCRIIVANPSTDRIEIYNALSGTMLTSYELDPANSDIWGVVWDNDVAQTNIYTNDNVDPHTFFTQSPGGSWTAIFNPDGIHARGMDFFQSYIFQAHGTGGGIWSFEPVSGGNTHYYSTPEASDTQTGLAVFPYNGGTCVAVCTEQNQIHFYNWNGSGSALSYMGYADVPVPGIAETLGLSYSNGTGTLFLTCRDSSDNWHLTELSFDISSLANFSWGSIKHSF